MKGKGVIPVVKLCTEAGFLRGSNRAGDYIRLAREEQRPWD